MQTIDDKKLAVMGLMLTAMGIILYAVTGESNLGIPFSAIGMGLVAFALAIKNEE